MNRVMAYEQTQTNKLAAHVGSSSDIKEMMNTSAPICIANYIKDNQGNARPSTKANSRRQASFGNVATGNNSNSVPGSGARRSAAITQGKPLNHVVGMVSG